MRNQVKAIVAICLILVLSLSVIGCGKQGLPEGFDQEEVGTAAEEIVGFATAGDYDAVVMSLREDLKGSITADQLRESWGPIYENAGAFKSVTKTTFSSTADESTGEEYAVVQVLVKHENANLLYTISFDKDFALVGLYLK